VTAAGVLFAAAPRCSAQVYEEALGRWELGLDAEILYPTRKRQFSHVLDNSVYLQTFFPDPLIDETSEGFVPPPAGISTISGTMNDTPGFGLHGYYHENDWFAWGLEGGWDFRKNLHVDSGGVFNTTPQLGMREDVETYHFSPVARFGPFKGNFRPYLSVGPDVSIFHYQINLSFIDPDDFIKPITVVDEYDVAFGVNAGAGLEWRVAENGTLQLSCSYHAFYGSASVYDYFLPRLNFVFYF